jgi:hypothetical protein
MPPVTEARLMFEQLRCTHLRRGDVHRFGPQHIRKGMIRTTTEKSGFDTLVEMPVHPDLIDAINATEIGDEVLTGKHIGGRIVPMAKEAWAAKFKKYAIVAGVNEAKKNCHGVRKARAEDAAYAGMTESQMMACFGWTDPKMAAHYIAQANRAILGSSGMAKMFERDRSANISNRPAMNERVTFLSNKRKKRLRNQRLKWVWCARRDSNPHDFTHCHLKAARLPIPPRALGIPAGTMRPAGSTAPM